MTESKNVALVKQFHHAVNSKDVASVWDKCLSEHFLFHHSKVPMPLDKKTFSGMMIHDILPSFPDFNFNVTDKSLKDNKDGTVAATVHITATHSGKPFGFMGMEPVPTSNKKVTLEPEEGTVKISEGQIVSITVNSNAEIAGPMGLYILIGGKPPSPGAMLVSQFFESVNHKDGRAVWTKLLSDKFSFIHTKVPHPLDKKSFMGLMFDDCVPSFPDFSFNLKKSSIKENKDGTISATVHVTGTHTGKAFGFAGLEPVPTSNKKVDLPEEYGTITISEGQIVTLSVVPSAEPSGPMGAYIMIGGKPPKHEEKKA